MDVVKLYKILNVISGLFIAQSVKRMLSKFAWLTAVISVVGM